MGTLAFPEENLDNLHSFLDLNLPLEPFPLNGLKEDWLGCLPSPDHSQDISENSLGTSLNHSASTHLAFDDLLFKHDPAAFLPTPLSESPPTGCQRSSSQEAKPTGRLRAQTSRSSADGSAGAAAPRPKGQRTAAAMERNRRGARKFRERQKQKFSDLTNRVDMLETELVAMKLCKLKMEADKTQVEVHAKELEKALSALQAAANPDLVEGDEEDLEAELGAHAAAKDEHEGAYLAVPDGPTVPADKQSIKGLSYTQAFAIYKGYIQALRTCLNEMEDGEASREGSQHSVGQLIRDLVIFATRMQATSPVPLWQLYHKQESCHNTSTSFVFEHQMLEKLDLSDDQKSTLAAALHRYQGAFSALAQERSAINAALVAAAAPGKDGLKKAHEAMWALKCSLAKEPRYTEAFLSACLRALTPLQTAKLIVGYFPVSVWPDFTALCACIALDAGEVSVLDGPV